MALVTGVNSIDALVYRSWAEVPGTAVALTYSFLTAVAAGRNAMDAQGFAPMSATQQAAAGTAMASWAAVANVTFTHVADGGDIQLGTNTQGQASSAYAYYPDHGDPSYLLINNTPRQPFGFAAGEGGASMLIHELGHSLGLKHPGDYDSDGVAKAPFLPTATDSQDYTQMSYVAGYSYTLTGDYAATPMLYDIQAIQYLYGANMAYHAGADNYRIDDGAAPHCIWDAGGFDVLDFSGCAGATIIDLRQGHFSATAPGVDNLSIAYGVTIEAAVAGSGGSTIYGNDAGNLIVGGIRADVIHLGLGDDTVSGGGGADIAVFNLDLSHYTLEREAGVLTVAGEGADLLKDVPTFYFKDLQIRPDNYLGISGGGGGDDVFRGGTGAELFSGGAGLDTVVYAAARANFTLVVCGDGHSCGVLAKSGAGGDDLVTGVERLHFADGAGVALDLDGAAGQTYRMYQAAFNRAPDLGGVGYWLDKMDHGLGLVAMARYFLDSAENAATYGALTDAQFVNQMYANVLHRAPDAGGLDFYLKGFAAGAVSREMVLASFSESAENQAAVIGSISNGVSYTAF